ncbi:MAG: hypothetical protein NDF54_11415 [archaeon GB-1867-035]|nr:hypothetical protein [Candidatus Culexmicrobium profundum]
MPTLVLKHYSKANVQSEIVKWCCAQVDGFSGLKKRWVAFHCRRSKDDEEKFILVRYLKGDPLLISSERDFQRYVKIFGKLGLRTVYATANIYGKLYDFEHVVDLNNIIACTPTWDIDNDLLHWKATIAVCREIASFLESNGITRSIIIKWSGEGAHVHLHHNALSPELRRNYNPLDLAYALVEYTIMKLEWKFHDISFSAESLRVDNEHDPQRLFTCPLSLHRSLNRVAVCINLNDLDAFDLSWTDVESFRHYYDWNKFEVGEADDLALKAIEVVGRCPYFPKGRRRKHPPVDELILKWLKKLEDLEC